MTTIVDGDLPSAYGAGGGSSESSKSAVSWAAIIAGAVVAAGASLILLSLGAGLGFAASSPWPGTGPSLAAFSIGAGIWLIVTQWVASLLGGYIAGRLRTRWTGVHTHEVFFRDTAHGFVTWALATVFVVGVATATGSMAAGASANAAGPALAYETDTLLRSTQAQDSATAATTRAEIGRILARSTGQAGASADDRAYLARLVSSRTGLSQPEAQSRVDNALNAVRKAADDARKAASATAFFTALSMVIGAFIASVAAALGGQLRDEHP